MPALHRGRLCHMLACLLSDDPALTQTQFPHWYLCYIVSPLSPQGIDCIFSHLIYSDAPNDGLAC